MTEHQRGFVLAGTALVAVTFGLARYAYGLFVPAIQRDLGLTTAAVGGIASLAFLAYLLTSITSGLLTPHIGPRLPSLLGGGSAVGGMLLVGLAHDPWLLALGVTLAGASPGWAYPPMPTVAATLLPAARRERALAWINAGTSFGVVISGPLALWAGANWRLAWLLFAGLALVSLVWYLPPLYAASLQRAHIASVTLRWHWFATSQVARLLVVSAITGLTSSIFWTFAVDVLVTTGGLSSKFGIGFWVVVGVAGILGGRAGMLLEHYGLPLVLRGTVGLLATALAILGLFSFNWLAGLVSAILFGTGFILMTGILLLWSVRLFPTAPSVGLGTTLLLIGTGQVIGPWLAGWLALQITLPSVFMLAALVMGGAVVGAPPREHAPDIVSLPSCDDNTAQTNPCT